jgi:two-component system chemotaxis sensor kinase CheA
MAMDDLTREFLIESQEGLDRMERCLTELESKPSDTGLLAEIFRTVHTIKGTVGFLGFARLEKLAHSGENLLGLLREGKLAADGPVITGLLQLQDGLRSILKSIENEGNEGEDADAVLIGRLVELQVPAMAAQGGRGRSGHVTGPAVRDETLAGQAGTAVMDSSTTAAPECGWVGASPTWTDKQGEEDKNHHDGNRDDENQHQKNQKERDQDKQDSERKGPDGKGKGPGADASKLKPIVVTTAAESTLRVDVTLLNRMMNLVGELVLTRNQVLQATSSNPNLTMLSRRLDMVTSDLRESVMKARMQPVSNIFSKMPRIVRDLSQSLGKRVRLQMEGQETELDKSLLEAIKDPLTHAVRNSLDHGVEDPNAREAAGKNPEGLLKLRAVQEGSHVIIEVVDDGAGIAVEKVRAKAIEGGLITAERSDRLGERELLQLIFLPGFSTAAAVTNVSGRGVGMDVVRTNVEKIGGKVEIDSKPGKGTTLRMRIPLTLAIIPALIVRSVQQSFAVPQGGLTELVHIPPDQAATAIEWMEGVPLYRLRGKLLPLVFLDRLLMPDGEHKDVTERDNFIAVLNADGRRFGLVVDGLADPEEIVVKPLSAVLKTIGLYSGATVLGNADLALILDPGAIAMKAGVAISDEEGGSKAEDEEIGEQAGKGLDYLLVEAAGRKAAVLLGDVLRIEQLRVSRIEYIGYRPVLNFEGQLLPVEDSGGVLAAVQHDPDAQIIVVVCRDGNRHVGIAVSHVLDVAAGGDLFEAGTSKQAEGVTLLKNTVTGVVDLSGVAPLPVDEHTTCEWSQTTEVAR